MIMQVRAAMTLLSDPSEMIIVRSAKLSKSASIKIWLFLKMCATANGHLKFKSGVRCQFPLIFEEIFVR